MEAYQTDQDRATTPAPGATEPYQRSIQRRWGTVVGVRRDARAARAELTRSASTRSPSRSSIGGGRSRRSAPYLTYAPPTVPKTPRNQARHRPAGHRPAAPGRRQRLFVDDKLSPRHWPGSRLGRPGAHRAGPRQGHHLGGRPRPARRRPDDDQGPHGQDQGPPGETKPADAGASQWLTTMRTALPDSSRRGHALRRSRRRGAGPPGRSTRDRGRAIDAGQRVGQAMIERDVKSRTQLAGDRRAHPTRSTCWRLQQVDTGAAQRH